MSELDRILESTRADVERRRREVSQRGLERAAAKRLDADPPRPFRAALEVPRLTLIAEHKRRSPSAGVIREGASVTEIVQAYERGGAAAFPAVDERFAPAVLVKKLADLRHPKVRERSRADAIMVIVQTEVANEIALGFCVKRLIGLAILSQVDDPKIALVSQILQICLSRLVADRDRRRDRLL